MNICDHTKSSFTFRNKQKVIAQVGQLHGESISPTMNEQRSHKHLRVDTIMYYNYTAWCVVKWIMIFHNFKNDLVMQFHNSLHLNWVMNF